MFMMLKKGLGIRFGSCVEGSTAIDRFDTLSISANYAFPINIFQLLSTFTDSLQTLQVLRR